MNTHISLDVTSLTSLRSCQLWEAKPHVVQCVDASDGRHVQYTDQVTETLYTVCLYPCKAGQHIAIQFTYDVATTVSQHSYYLRNIFLKSSNSDTKYKSDLFIFNSAKWI